MEILGEESSEEESGDEGDEEDESSDEEPDDGISTSQSFICRECTDNLIAEADGTVDVHDQTQGNSVNLRRTIYLTIVRSERPPTVGAVTDVRTFSDVRHRL